MRVSGVVIKHFCSLSLLDVPLLENTPCVLGENNAGKSNFLQAARLYIDSILSSKCRVLTPNDAHSAVHLKTANHVLVGLGITGVKTRSMRRLWLAVGRVSAALGSSLNPSRVGSPATPERA